MARLLSEQLGVERWLGLPEVITGIGTSRTLREPLEQALPMLLCL